MDVVLRKGVRHVIGKVKEYLADPNHDFVFSRQRLGD